MSEDVKEAPKRARRKSTPATALAQCIAALDRLQHEECRRTLACIDAYYAPRADADVSGRST